MLAKPVVRRIEDPFGKRINHFRVYFENMRGTGFGTDTSETVALLKAFSEAVERSVFWKLSIGGSTITSSGYAAHSNFHLAATSARYELLERDAFMVMWISGQHPRWIPDSDVPKQLRHEFEELQKNGFTVTVGQIAICEGDVHVWIGVLRCNKFTDVGVVVSTSAAKARESAMLNIIYDLRRAAGLIEVRKNAGGTFNFEAEVRSATDTLEFYLNPKNKSAVIDLLQSSGEILHLGGDQVSIAQIPHDIEDLPWDIVVAHATSERLQQLYFGAATDQKVNQKRFDDLKLNVVRRSVSPLP